jgi:hypothetical protein
MAIIVQTVLIMSGIAGSLALMLNAGQPVHRQLRRM